MRRANPLAHGRWVGVDFGVLRRALSARSTETGHLAVALRWKTDMFLVGGASNPGSDWVQWREFQKLAEPVQPNRVIGSAKGLRYKRSPRTFRSFGCLGKRGGGGGGRGVAIFPLDEGLDPLLDHGRIGQDARLQLLGDLCDEAIEIQHPLGFHDPDNGSIDLILPGFLHFLANLLLLRLLLCCRQHIHVRNTSKRPKAPLEVRQWYRSCLLDVLAAQPHENAHLAGRNIQPVLLAVSDGDHHIGGAQVPEKRHHFVEDDLYIILSAGSLRGFTECVVDVQRNEFWRSAVEIDKILERSTHSSLESLVVTEYTGDDLIILILLIQKPPNKVHRIPRAPCIRYQLLPCFPKIAYRRDAPGTSPEQAVQSAQVFILVTEKHTDEAGVHVDQSSHVFGNHLLLHDAKFQDSH
ncbi:hypothetical protein MUK42_32665 [Musa troglodytarum]|uniref:Uncharacterized protein n=1 Tax=Musa troglodytarum TaxID=320322 RepID=A0A9E7F022_9LILI|nr:hypothetical protein MUK42_32665 [Musa troglodytarum]